MSKQVWPTRPRTIEMRRGDYATEDGAIEAAHTQPIPSSVPRGAHGRMDRMQPLMAEPSTDGRFGEFGGRFVPETLVPACLELEDAFRTAWSDPEFRGELDRLLGSVLTYADESFNTILELGFATSIRKEWAWRNLRGESTRNLEAFKGWLDSGGEQDGGEGEHGG